jgi:transposase
MSEKNPEEKSVKDEREALQELEDFIGSNPDPRELKRALAIRMLIEGISRGIIQALLGVSSPFISKWKVNYALQGIEGLKLKYQGSIGQIKPEEKKEIIEWLQSKSYWSVLELENHIEERYKIKFKSKESYYELLKKARISWKKSQKKNPKRDEELVKKKHQEICKILEYNREAIEHGKLIVYLIDECHLVWADICGYVWGKSQERIEIPMTNERERQTYYGGINYLTKQFFMQEYPTANSGNTVSFLKYLQSLNPEAKHLIIWDGASYHKYKEMRDYLEEINQGLKQEDWSLTCVLFAPNAPDQNPVEDIWLKAKSWVRKYWYRFTSFSQVRWFFNFVIQKEIFDFPKLNKYGSFEPKINIAVA